MTTLTTEEIIEMARETLLASWHKDLKKWQIEQGVEAFAKLVATKAAEREREECAKVCEDFSKTHGLHTKHCVAAAIRARGITQV